MNLSRALPRLRAFAAREGHVRVKFTHTEDGFRLGFWVSAARKAYRQGSLSTADIAQLEALPGWTWNGYRGRDNQGVRASSVQNILRYVAEGGDLTAVTRKTLIAGMDLHRAISALRGRYTRGELSNEVVQRLEALPGWEWCPRFTAFATRVEELKAFHAAHGHLDVPTTQQSGHRALSVWLRSQRYQYLEGRLDHGRVALLQSVPGWCWDLDGAVPPSPPPQRAPGTHVRLSNDAVVALLERFALRYGHTRVPKHHVEDGFRLGQWVRIRRRYFRRGQLDARLATRIAALPGWTWDPIRDRTNNGITPAAATRLLTRYTRAHGPLHALDHTTLFEGVRLCRVVQRLRKMAAEQRLSAAQCTALETIPGWTWTKADQTFQHYYSLLLEFVREHGHARVPQNHVQNGVRLGRFVTRARMLYHNNELPESHVRRMEALPEWRWQMKRSSQSALATASV